MDILVIVLRLFHIFGGVFWAGGAFMLAGYIEPTARGLGPDGGRFMQRFAGQSGFSQAMSIAAMSNMIAGILLYWRDSGGLRPEWIMTGAGLTFTIGAIAAFISAGFGFGGNARTAAQMTALGKQIASAGGPPTPAQMSQMQAFQEKLRQGGMRVSVFMVIALIAMATARYI